MLSNVTVEFISLCHLLICNDSTNGKFISSKTKTSNNTKAGTANHALMTKLLTLVNI